MNDASDRAPAEVPTSGRFRPTGVRTLISTIGLGYLIAAVVLGVLGVVLINEQPEASALAAVLIQATTLPVLLAKIAPQLASGPAWRSVCC